MLKIKDGVDLKELEEFGFRKHRCHYVKDCFEEHFKDIRITVEGGKMATKDGRYGNIYGIYYYSNEPMLLTLLNLSQAGMVEEVEGKK